MNSAWRVYRGRHASRETQLNRIVRHLLSAERRSIRSMYWRFLLANFHLKPLTMRFCGMSREHEQASERGASIGHHLTLFGQNTFQFYLPRVCECDCVINSIQIIEASDKRSNRPNRWVFVFVIIRIDALLDDPHIIRLGEAKAKKHTHTAAWTWIYGVRPKKHL